MTIELKPCPFCGRVDKLDLQFRQAMDKKHRYGKHDAAIYCRKCYAYGPRIKSEDLLLPECDFRNEGVTITFKDRMREAALNAWNRRTQLWT